MQTEDTEANQSKPKQTEANQSKLKQSILTITEELLPFSPSAELIFNYEKPYYNSMLQEFNKGVKDVSPGDIALGPWSRGTRRGS